MRGQSNAVVIGLHTPAESPATPKVSWGFRHDTFGETGHRTRCRAACTGTAPTLRNSVRARTMVRARGAQDAGGVRNPHRPAAPSEAAVLRMEAHAYRASVCAGHLWPGRSGSGTRSLCQMPDRSDPSPKPGCCSKLAFKTCNRYPTYLGPTHARGKGVRTSPCTPALPLHRAHPLDARAELACPLTSMNNTIMSWSSNKLLVR